MLLIGLTLLLLYMLQNARCDIKLCCSYRLWRKNKFLMGVREKMKGRGKEMRMSCEVPFMAHGGTFL